MGTRSEVIQSGAIADTPIRRGKREEILAITTNLTSGGGTAFTVTAKMPPNILLGASATRNIRLPALADVPIGTIFNFISRSTTTTGVLTLLTATGAALSPAVAIVQNGAASVISCGTALGWKRRTVAP